VEGSCTSAACCVSLCFAVDPLVGVVGKITEVAAVLSATKSLCNAHALGSHSSAQGEMKDLVGCSKWTPLGVGTCQHLCLWVNTHGQVLRPRFAVPVYKSNRLEFDIARSLLIHQPEISLTLQQHQTWALRSAMHCCHS